MIISEVNAVLDLVVKATTFTTQLQDGWYKGSAELAAFEDKVWVLSAKHAQWSEQLQRYGVYENMHLRRLVKAAEKALEKQQQSVQKLQKSPFRRWKKRVFPGQLSYFLDKVSEIVDAGPQLLASRVANNDLLERYLAQTPVLLPFGPDRNYVPIADSILALQNALEKAEGPRVVTVYGGPGMGKSSLAKYLAIHYQEEQKRLRADAAFPHGVYYLYCGQDAGKRIQQLQVELLANLGFGNGSATPNDPTTSASTGSQEGDYIALSSNQVKLRSHLAEQKLLIMLDDLWDAKVLRELLVPAEGVKYLVTSQMSDVYLCAEKIRMNRPCLRESSQILANYTDGFPKKGEFPHNIESVAEEIIHMVEYHPLSLANIGISINSSRATDVKQWGAIKKHIYNHLDENDCSPPAYDRPYSLPVSAAMMLMVESLPPEAQRLLFLVCLLQGQQLPEPLVQYFYSFIQPDNFLLKYNKHERYLEDKSLIELTALGNRLVLDTHRVRTHYILDSKKPEVRSIGSQILTGNGDQDVAKLISRGDEEETLVTVLSAMYFDQSLIDIVECNLGKLVGKFHVNLIDHGVIPRSLNKETHELDLVKSARRKHYEIEGLIWLLTADHEEGTWKRQAHESAKKIIIKFICQGKLADDGMASLLQLPETTSTACAALRAIYHCHGEDFFERNVTFSQAHGVTMRTLLDLFDSNVISVERRTSVIHALVHVLDFESRDTIFDFSAKCVKLFSMECNRNLHNAVTHALASTWLGRGIGTMAEFSGILESFLVLLASGNDNELRQSAIELIHRFCKYRPTSLKIAIFPDAITTLFQIFLSQGLNMFSSNRHREMAGECLCGLSIVPENRIKLGAIEGIWDGLGGVLTKLEDSWRGIHNDLDRWVLERQARTAAGIIGFLALEKDLRATIAALPGIREGLLFLQCIEMGNQAKRSVPDGGILLTYYYSTRALIVLYFEELSDPTDLQLIGDAKKLFPCDDDIPSKAMEHGSYVSLYLTRVLAYTQIGSYAEGLKNLDLADYHFSLTTKLDPLVLLYCENSSIGFTIYMGLETVRMLRDCRIFLQAMVEDYRGAFVGVNRRIEEALELGYEAESLAERGALKRLSGDLQGALDDLNRAATLRPTPEDTLDVLRQRGYVKYLMDDKTGATDDAESAQKLKLDKCLDCIVIAEGEDLWQLRKIPVSYLGFSL